MCRCTAVIRRQLIVMILLSCICAVVIPICSAATPQHIHDHSHSHKQALAWFAPFFSGGGYSSEAISFAHVLSNVTSLRIVQHGDSFNEKFVQNMDSGDASMLQRLRNIAPVSNEVVVCHSEPGAWHAPFPHYHTSRCPPANAKYKIGRTMFETDRIPTGWQDRLNTMDEVWVPTLFSADAFIKSGVNATKVVVVPEPVDTTFFSPDSNSGTRHRAGHSIGHVLDVLLPADQIPVITSGTFTFLFVGKWEHRKGVHILLRAFFNEFTSGLDSYEEVLLVVVTSAYHSTTEFRREAEDFLRREGFLTSGSAEQLLRRIVLLSEVPQATMPALYRASGVLVIPSRGEGWGRPHVESMACGTPVIATNWSGVTGYLTERNGYPLAVEGLVDAQGWTGHKWAEPSLAHLQFLMRHVLLHPEEVMRKGLVARQEMVQQYSYEAFGKAIFPELDRIFQYLHWRQSRQQNKKYSEL
mmetsp:Transcript_21005/g.30319  ORF Transcript_21005/g.30319 Transcript_21005/m.30319 type:complete len:469 (-) Transcript_21005:84-1490(-)